MRLIQSISGFIRYPSPSYQRSLYPNCRGMPESGSSSREPWHVSSRCHPNAFVLSFHSKDLSHISLVRHVPEWVPGASFKKKARIWRETVLRLPMAPYEAVMEALVSGLESVSKWTNYISRTAHGDSHTVCFDVYAGSNVRDQGCPSSS